MAKMQPNRDVKVRWNYLPLETVMKSVDLEKSETYLLHNHNTVTQYIPTWTILELCIAENQRPGAQVSMRWGEQAILDLGQEDTGMEK